MKRGRKTKGAESVAILCALRLPASHPLAGPARDYMDRIVMECGGDLNRIAERLAVTGRTIRRMLAHIREPVPAKPKPPQTHPRYSWCSCPNCAADIT